ncbi:MAG: hypothetical protein U0V02_09060 [Anaerolineales bacterium]
MGILDVFASIGMFINDVMAGLSVLGSTILLFGAFSKTPLRRYGPFANWSFAGLAFGLLCQISMAITGTTPERIGFLMPMSALMVDALLGVSILMLTGRWLIRKTLNKA